MVFHPAGAEHADDVGCAGLETLSLCFDPCWLDAEARAALPGQSWSRAGGPSALAARRLAALWLSRDASDEEVRAATSRFVLDIERTPNAPKRPAWIEEVETSLAPDLHPAWLARAYRAWRGEGMAETARRRRVERAVQMLRAGGETLGAIAADTGFCDQSHMNRCFNAVLGRTPLDVRREASLLAAVV